MTLNTHPPCQLCGLDSKSVLVADFGHGIVKELYVCAQCQELVIQVAEEMGYTRCVTDDRNIMYTHSKSGKVPPSKVLN